MHSYKGYKYQLRVMSRYVAFRVFQAGLKKTLGRWVKFKRTEVYDSGDYKQEVDECEENFIIRVHQSAHEYIDAVAEKREYNLGLIKIANDKSVEFLSRISK